MLLCNGKPRVDHVCSFLKRILCNLQVFIPARMFVCLILYCQLICTFYLFSSHFDIILNFLKMFSKQSKQPAPMSPNDEPPKKKAKLSGHLNKVAREKKINDEKTERAKND